MSLDKGFLGDLIEAGYNAAEEGKDLETVKEEAGLA